MKHILLERPKHLETYWVLLPGESVDTIQPKDLVEAEWHRAGPGYWQAVHSKHIFESYWYMEVPNIDD